jgi:hypothetical protein
MKICRADELKNGDIIVSKASSISQTATGHISVWLSDNGRAASGKLRVFPPDEMFTVLVPDR